MQGLMKKDDPDFVDPSEHLLDPHSRYGFSGGDILHPSDLNVDEGRAFAHALAIAVRLQARLTLLHAGKRSDSVDGMAFPHVRETLIRWKLLPPGSTQDDVYDRLGLEVKKLARRSVGPVKAIEEHLATRDTDMIVMATRGEHGLPEWIGSSVSRKVARDAPTRVLYVPSTAQGFVSAEDGSIRLRRVVVPLDHSPDPRVAVLAASRFARALGQDNVEFLVLHVGKKTDRPVVDLPEGRWKWVHRLGPPANEILALAERKRADLIVMATEGSHGLLDALRGSTTAQVLAAAPCPVAAMPARMFRA
jgi:nucleotide-binding universal stress UspA family protein